jgi:hypothetical protein
MNRISRALAMVRSECLWAVTSAGQRRRFNRFLYDRDATYLPGGAYYDQGLFDWEREIIENDFPNNGTILVGGAGGGREVKALIELDYYVIASEPSSKAFSELKKLEGEKCKVFQTSYSEWIAQKLFSFERIDAVLLGWGSFSYLYSNAERVAFLRYIRKIAPSAPVLLSFLCPALGPRSRLEKLRWFTNAGDAFNSVHGFVHFSTPEEIKGLAHSTGYAIKKGNLIPYPHVLLVGS